MFDVVLATTGNGDAFSKPPFAKSSVVAALDGATSAHDAMVTAITAVITTERGRLSERATLRIELVDDDNSCSPGDRSSASSRNVTQYCVDSAHVCTHKLRTHPS